MSFIDEIRQRFPLAPTWEQWRTLTPREQQAVYDALPTEDPAAAPPEGTRHLEAKITAFDTLRRFYRRSGRKAFVASELAVHHPGERVFIPDVLMVFDVEDHDRTKWLVTREGRGLDFVLEVHDGGERKKDLERRREQLARVKVPEYFIFDRNRGALHGYELPDSDATTYRPILPQIGRYRSNVLGLELQLLEGRLRFTVSDSLLPETTELMQRLENAVSELEIKREEEQRLREEEQGRREEAEKEIARLRARLAALGEKADNE